MVLVGWSSVNWPELAYLRVPGTVSVSIAWALLGLAFYCIAIVVTITARAGSGHLVLTLATVLAAATLIGAGFVALRSATSRQSARARRG